MPFSSKTYSPGSHAGPVPMPRRFKAAKVRRRRIVEGARGASRDRGRGDRRGGRTTRQEACAIPIRLGSIRQGDVLTRGPCGTGAYTHGVEQREIQRNRVIERSRHACGDRGGIQRRGFAGQEGGSVPVCVTEVAQHDELAYAPRRPCAYAKRVQRGDISRGILVERPGSAGGDHGGRVGGFARSECGAVPIDQPAAAQIDPLARKPGGSGVEPESVQLGHGPRGGVVEHARRARSDHRGGGRRYEGVDDFRVRRPVEPHHVEVPLRDLRYLGGRDALGSQQDTDQAIEDQVLVRPAQQKIPGYQIIVGPVVPEGELKGQDTLLIYAWRRRVKAVVTPSYSNVPPTGRPTVIAAGMPLRPP